MRRKSHCGEPRGSPLPARSQAACAKAAEAATPSVALEIFEQGHAIGLGHVRAEDMAAIPVSVVFRLRVDEAVLGLAVLADHEAEVHRIIIASAERECLRPLIGRK